MAALTEDVVEGLLVMGVMVSPAPPTHPERAVVTLSRVMAMTQWEYLTAPLAGTRLSGMERELLVSRTRVEGCGCFVSWDTPI